MDRFLAIIAGIVFLLWFINYDPDEHLAKRSEAISPANKKIPPTEKIEAAKPKFIRKDDDRLLFPIKGKSWDDVISGFGDARDQGKRKHKGIDIREKKGTPVIAITDGEIKKVTNRGSGGKQIWLSSENNTFFYAHLDSWLVEEGDYVESGEIIGTVGTTGNASTPHLHFEIRTTDGRALNPAAFYELND